MDSSIVKRSEEKRTEGSDDHSGNAVDLDETEIDSTIFPRGKSICSEVQKDPFVSAVVDVIEKEKRTTRDSSDGEQKMQCTDTTAEGLPTMPFLTAKEHNEESAQESLSSSPFMLPQLTVVFPRRSSAASHSPSPSSRVGSSSSGNNSRPTHASSLHYFEKGESPVSNAPATPTTCTSSVVLPSDAGQNRTPFVDRCPPLPSIFQTIPTKDRRENASSSVITPEDKRTDTSSINGQTKANAIASFESTGRDEEVEEPQSGESLCVSKALSEPVSASPIALPLEREREKQWQGNMSALRTDCSTLQSNALEPPLTLPFPPPIPSNLSNVSENGLIPPFTTNRNETKKGWCCCSRSNFIKIPPPQPLPTLHRESTRPILSLVNEVAPSAELLRKNANDSTRQLSVLPLTSSSLQKGESGLAVPCHSKKDLFHAAPDEKTVECPTASSSHEEERREEMERGDTDAEISPVPLEKDEEKRVEADQLEQPGTIFSTSATPELNGEDDTPHGSIDISRRTGHAACSKCDSENVAKGVVDKADEFSDLHPRSNGASESSCSSAKVEILNRSANSNSTFSSSSRNSSAQEFASVQSNAHSANVTFRERDSEYVSSSGGSTSTMTEMTLSRSSLLMNSKKSTWCSRTVTPLHLISNERLQASLPYSVSHPRRILLPYRSAYYEDKCIESATTTTFSARSITSFPTRSTHSTRKSEMHGTLLTPFHSSMKKWKRSLPPHRSSVAQHQCSWNKATATSLVSSGDSYYFRSQYSLPLNCRCRSQMPATNRKKNTTRSGTSSASHSKHIRQHFCSGNNTDVFTPSLTSKGHRSDGKPHRVISERIPEKVFSSFFSGSPFASSANGSRSGMSPSDLRRRYRLPYGVSRIAVHQDGGAVAPLPPLLPSLCSFEHCPVRDSLSSSSFGNQVNCVPSRKGSMDEHHHVCTEDMMKKNSGLRRGEFSYIPPRSLSSRFHSAGETVKPVKFDKDSVSTFHSPYREEISGLSPVFAAAGRINYPFGEERLEYDLDATLLPYEKVSKTASKVPLLHRACKYLKSARTPLLKSRSLPSVSLCSQDRIEFSGRDGTIIAQKRYKREDDEVRSVQLSNRCSCRRRKSCSRSPFAYVVRQPHMVGC